MTEPIFLPWDEPLLPQAARHLSRRFRRGPEIALEEVTLVVPGARGGRRLMELLVEEGERAGASLIPPARIVTPGAIPELLYRSDRPVATRLEARRAWAKALSHVPAAYLEPVFPNQDSSRSLASRVAMARILDEINREVGASGKSFRDVAEACRDGLVYADDARWGALAEIQDRYLRVLEQGGFRDRDWARRRALRDGSFAIEGEIVLLGIAEMPLLTKSILSLVRDRTSVYVHAPTHLAEAFDEMGCLNRRVWLERPPVIAEEILSVRDRPPDQASRVLEIIRDLEGRYPPEAVTLGVPDEEVVPFLEQQLSAFGLPHRYAEGFPLPRTLPCRLLEASADLLESRRFEALAGLLRHPDIAVLLAEGPTLEAADEYFARHLPDRLPRPLTQLPDGGGKLRKALDLLLGPELLGSLEGTRRTGAWMPEIMALLARVFGHRSLNPAKPEDRRIIESCNRIREIAEELRDIPEALDEEVTAAEAIHLLVSELREERLPPQAEDDALELVGWLELHLDDAPLLILTGVNEPSLPRSVSGDPFLPNGLRRRLGLEDNDARLARDAYRLSAILASRPTGDVHIIAGRRSNAGDPLRPSRLLFMDGGPGLARRTLRFTAEEDTSNGRRELPYLPVRPSPASRFVLPPERAIPIPKIPQPLSVTDLGKLLADPYLWALEKYLGLREVDDDERELDPAGFGSLTHRVLELFGRSDAARETDPDRISHQLSQLLDEVARQRFGPSPLPTVPLQVEQLRSRLATFARWQAERVAAGWQILAVEARTPPEGIALDIDGTPFFLSGRIDRIDLHSETGTWAVLDYKTGDRAKGPEQTHGGPGAWKDLQLPLYRHLLGQIQDADGAPIQAPGPGDRIELGYVCVSRNNKDPGILRLAPWGATEVEDALETAKARIRSLRENREVAFDPATTGRRAEGALAALLGRGLVLGEGDDSEEDGSGS